jgi:serine/threonine protein kinase
LAGDAAALSRLRSEVATAHRVTHLNVCRIFDLGFDRKHDEAEPLVFLTMEYLPGQTLSRYLAHKGPLRPTEAFPLLRQLAEGLAAAHQVGIVHRDLKADNVMLVESRDGKVRAVITDFGLAGSIADTPVGAGRGSGFSGTLAYAAPELLTGARATSASDVYSFGLIAYEVLAGSLPTVRAAAPSAPQAERPMFGVSVGWRRLIAQATEPDPRRRPADGVALAERVRRLERRVVSLSAGRHGPLLLASVLGVGVAILVFGRSDVPRASVTVNAADLVVRANSPSGLRSAADRPRKEVQSQSPAATSPSRARKRIGRASIAMLPAKDVSSRVDGVSNALAQDESPATDLLRELRSAPPAEATSPSDDSRDLVNPFE